MPKIKTREFQTYIAWRKAVKGLKSEVEFTGDKDIDSASVKIGDQEYICEWDGAKGIIEPRVFAVKSSQIQATDKSQDMLKFAKQYKMAIVRVTPKEDITFTSYSSTMKTLDFTQGKDPFDLVESASFEAGVQEHLLLSKSGLSFYFYDEDERSWSKAFSCHLQKSSPVIKIFKNFTGIEDTELLKMFGSSCRVKTKKDVIEDIEKTKRELAVKKESIKAPAKKKIKSAQKLTKELYYEGPIRSEKSVKAFLNKQFDGKNRFAVPKVQPGDVVTSFRIILPNEVPESSIWIQGLNEAFWKAYPELKDNAGFGY